MRSRRAAGVRLSLSTAGCAASGPVFGEWQGEQPGPSRSAPNQVDLVLEGPVSARTWHYRISSLVQTSAVSLGARTRDRGGTWVMEDQTVRGRTLQVIRLLQPLPGDVAEYALTPDGALHALDPDGVPDDRPVDAYYTLSPVRPEPSRGPGRPVAPPRS